MPNKADEIFQSWPKVHYNLSAPVCFYGLYGKKNKELENAKIANWAVIKV